MISIRSSATPLLFNCAAALDPTELTISATNDAADVGTAVHEALRSLAETGSLDWDAIPEIAEKHSVPVDDVRVLCALANKLWPQIKESFPNALTEVELAAEVLPGVMLTGHVDLLTITGTVARAGDWKSGRVDSPYRHQMMAYGTLILADDQSLTEATVTIVWLRDAAIENFTVTRAASAAWVRELEAVLEARGVYRPGSHCNYCPRFHECPARTAMVRANVEAMTGLHVDLANMAPEQIITLLRQADTVRLVAEDLRAAVKEHVLRSGDIVADGTRITVDTEARRGLDPLLAFPVLEAAGFGDEDFAASMKLSVSKVEKRIATKAGRGNGAAAVRKIKAELEAAGAVNTNEVQKLALKRA